MANKMRWGKQKQMSADFLLFPRIFLKWEHGLKNLTATYS